MVKQIEALQIDYPTDFLLTVRHVSSFKNIEEYNIYIKEKFEQWKERSLET